MKKKEIDNSKDCFVKHWTLEPDLEDVASDFADTNKQLGTKWSAECSTIDTDISSGKIKLKGSASRIGDNRDGSSEWLITIVPPFRVRTKNAIMWLWKHLWKE